MWCKEEIQVYFVESKLGACAQIQVFLSILTLEFITKGIFFSNFVTF